MIIPTGLIARLIRKIAEGANRPVGTPDEPPPGEPKKPDEPPDAWDRSAAVLAKHGALPMLGALTILMMVIYSNVFHGEVAGDDLTFHMAESTRLADCLRNLDFDFWNPSANAGYASAYYYQVIPQMASAIPAAIFGSELFWFQLTVFLPLVLAPAAAYRGMRLIGATPWQALLAAACVGLMNGQSRWGAGNAGTFQVGLYTQTWALAGFPLALGHGARWISEGKGLASAIAWGTFCGLCHPFAGIALGIALGFGVAANLVLIGTDQLFAMLAPMLPPTGWPALLAQRWQKPPVRDFNREAIRLVILGGLLIVATLPGWITLLVDYDGFGGFPHRVNDEVGPGFQGLLGWHVRGQVLDFDHIRVLTWSLPVALIFARAKYLRWLWTPALVYVLFLGLGPHIGTTQDDLFPAVRFLGALQIVCALGIGSGAVLICGYLWRIVDGTTYSYGVRTAIAAVAAGLLVLVTIGGAQDLHRRVMTMPDFANNKRDQLFGVNAILHKEPPGRKQVAAGAENHWWNLLSYVYDRRPSLLQMGGGGLQASPNYDFLWTNRDFAKNAWLYDAPYLVFATSNVASMPKGEDLGHTQDISVRRLATPGLVSPVQITGTLPPGRKAAKVDALAWIKSDLPLKDHMLAYDGFGDAGDPPAGKTLRAWHQESPGDAADIVAELEVEKPTTFVVRESWHPRWHAYIDGDEAPVRRVTPDFPAVDVPAGKHTLALRFERPWWAQASWLAWPGVPFGVWFYFRRREKKRIPEARVVTA